MGGLDKTPTCRPGICSDAHVVTDTRTLFCICTSMLPGAGPKTVVSWAPLLTHIRKSCPFYYLPNIFGIRSFSHAHSPHPGHLPSMPRAAATSPTYPFLPWLHACSPHSSQGIPGGPTGDHVPPHIHPSVKARGLTIATQALTNPLCPLFPAPRASLLLLMHSCFRTLALASPSPGMFFPSSPQVCPLPPLGLPSHD
jgi:hypothetical protein